MKDYFSAKKIAFLALSAALVLVTTLFVKIPNPVTGYTNLGDAVVFLTAALFGPLFAGIAGSIGSALADIILGYAAYAPFTFLIKGAEGLLAGALALAFIKAKLNRHPAFIFACILAAAWMVAGYFAANCILYGVAAGIGGLVNDAIQGALGAAAGYLLALALSRVNVGALSANVLAAKKNEGENGENENSAR